MYLNNEDIETIIKVKEVLENNKNIVSNEEFIRYTILIDKIISLKKKNIKYKMNHIKEKRKTNKMYGRSKNEIERHEKMLKKKEGKDNGK